MLLDVIDIELNGDYKLLLTFENGELREFDRSMLLNEKPFDAIANPAMFKQKIEYGKVVCPNEIDIAPETLSLDSVAI